jgi:phosphoribosylaminoimidazole carboxylase PurE protein
MKAAIVMGSDSDLAIMKETVETLDKFGVGSFVSITSAHRTPDKVKAFLDEAKNQGCEVIIAAAGMAAHLAGVVAAHTTMPVIGVPLQAGSLDGLDALFATVQMPGGIPVATMAIGKAGAVNAAIFAVEILAVKYPELKAKLEEQKKELASGVEKKDKELREKGIKKYMDDHKK